MYIYLFMNLELSAKALGQVKCPQPEFANAQSQGFETTDSMDPSGYATDPVPSAAATNPPSTQRVSG